VLFHHTGSANINGTISWFLNRQSKVSSDFVIGKDGRIVRMVPKGWFGWHAGICTFQNKPTKLYNPLSYGIELVNRGDGIDPYPEVQLEAAAYVVDLIQKEAPSVTLLRRHGDVAWPPGRKVDPRGLSVETIYAAVKKYQPEVVLE
jgi:N-acetyl-anhydromuramyl-L-alanine amidase AmpD